MDFSTSRNRALQLAGFRCVFTLMLSGDESIRDGAAMREFLEKHKDWSWTTKSRKGKKKRPQHEAYNMRIIFGSMVYDSTRIARTDAHWFYTGATHEYVVFERMIISNDIHEKVNFITQEHHSHHSFISHSYTNAHSNVTKY